MKKETVLIVGAGNVGMRVISLLRRRARVIALTSSRDRRVGLRTAGARAVVADLDRPRTLAPLRVLPIDALVHLAPPPSGRGAHDPRTCHLLHAILPKRPKHFRLVYVSTTGVYGDCAGARFDETRPVHAESARAVRRIDAERQIGRAARRAGWRAAILRAPGIYDAQHLPLARLKAGTPALVEADDVYSNHIHADDLAAMCIAALGSRRRLRVYHACDDSELRMGEYFDLVADAFALARPPRMQRADIARAVDPVSLSFMRESRRLSNARIKRELRVRLKYPQVAAFLGGIAARNGTRE